VLERTQVLSSSSLCSLSLLNPHPPSPDQYLSQLLVHQPTPGQTWQKRRIQIGGERAQLPGWRVLRLSRSGIFAHVLRRFRTLNPGRCGRPTRWFVVVQGMIWLSTPSGQPMVRVRRTGLPRIRSRLEVTALAHILSAPDVRFRTNDLLRRFPLGRGRHSRVFRFSVQLEVKVFARPLVLFCLSNGRRFVGGEPPACLWSAIL